MAADNSAAQGRLCLKSLARQTLDVMRELGTATSDDLATVTVRRLKLSGGGSSGDETIRRRIYDVINVLSAAGVIDKVGKQLVWHGSRPTLPPLTREGLGVSPSDSRILSKERDLREKMTLLVLYKALVQRNFLRHAVPDGAIYLPAMIIAIKGSGKDLLTQFSNQLELEIKSSPKITFFSPKDILPKIGLPLDSIKQLLALAPKCLSQYAGHLTLIEGQGGT
jgi:hypothetical protein